DGRSHARIGQGAGVLSGDDLRGFPGGGTSGGRKPEDLAAVYDAAFPALARNAEAGLPPAGQRSRMSEIRPKRPPVRLDAKAYRELCKEVLERDGWRCQSCSSLSAAEVHHKRFRSHHGINT